ncbi:hypothetical protein BKA56DRAFT_638767 [Ilyonectria sp. MPI-CAGE-AT-0026]|nr:hypothetical protein BKA56DRAFT_638767 [Ilyonectria sp. MPI-CAGE-AT-0026]
MDCNAISIVTEIRLKISYQLEELLNNSIINSLVGSDKKLFQKPVDPDIYKLIKSVIKNGYIILKSAFTPAEVDKAIWKLYRLANGANTASPASAGSFVTLNNYFLDSGIYIQPSKEPQTLYYNDAYITLPRPYRLFRIIYAYTKTNGATIIGPDCIVQYSKAASIIILKGSIYSSGQNILDNKCYMLTVAKPFIGFINSNSSLKAAEKYL